MADEVFAVGPSVAVTERLYGAPTMAVGTVDGVMFTTAVAVLVVSA
jgi:hypothetical protein